MARTWAGSPICSSKNHLHFPGLQTLSNLSYNVQEKELEEGVAPLHNKVPVCNKSLLLIRLSKV